MMVIKLWIEESEMVWRKKVDQTQLAWVVPLPAWLTLLIDCCRYFWRRNFSCLTFIQSFFLFTPRDSLDLLHWQSQAANLFDRKSLTQGNAIAVGAAGTKSRFNFAKLRCCSGGFTCKGGAPGFKAATCLHRRERVCDALAHGIMQQSVFSAVCVKLRQWNEWFMEEVYVVYSSDGHRREWGRVTEHRGRRKGVKRKKFDAVHAAAEHKMESIARAASCSSARQIMFF